MKQPPSVPAIAPRRLKVGCALRACASGTRKEKTSQVLNVDKGWIPPAYQLDRRLQMTTDTWLE